VASAAQRLSGTRGDREDRLLHDWTPRILRAALGCGAALLVAGLCFMGAMEPESYVAEYRALQRGQVSGRAIHLGQLIDRAVHGHGRALLVAGLLVLTLVPIGRVAFTVVVFVVERDWVFAALTSLVLALLCLGVVLGQIG
jgi:uncharacterized membrane protein